LNEKKEKKQKTSNIKGEKMGSHWLGEARSFHTSQQNQKGRGRDGKEEKEKKEQCTRETLTHKIKNGGGGVGGENEVIHVAP